MLRKLYRSYKKAGFAKQALLSVPLTLIIGIEIAIGTFLAEYIYRFLHNTFNVEISTSIIVFLYLPLMFAPVIIDFFWEEIKALSKIKFKKKRKKKNISIEKHFSALKEEVARWYTSTFGITPHLDKYINLHERLKVIMSQKFRSYDKGARFIKVSENDKWVKIFNKYYPLDLICGYDNTNNELYFIDGYTVKLPKLACIDKYNRAIDTFFDKRGYMYDNLPPASKESFDKIVADSINTFEKVDWATLRYEWEMAIAKEKGNTSKKSSANSNHLMTHSGKLKQIYYTRPLSQAEITRTTEVFKNGNRSIAEITDFNAYLNEYCVCNGVKILGELGYPANTKGLDFLFTCLKDVDEACFLPAVDVLSKVPLDVLAPTIEEKAREAYMKCDVLRLGGILYLAKNLNYEIEYVKELKMNAKAQEGPDMTSVDENGSVRFDPEQSEQFTGNQAVAFKKS